MSKQMKIHLTRGFISVIQSFLKLYIGKGFVYCPACHCLGPLTPELAPPPCVLRLPFIVYTVILTLKCYLTFCPSHLSPICSPVLVLSLERKYLLSYITVTITAPSGLCVNSGIFCYTGVHPYRFCSE